eukprot:scaffold18_cov401-Prasinococcus_capsulatus_cf.AAC.9
MSLSRRYVDSIDVDSALRRRQLSADRRHVRRLAQVKPAPVPGRLTAAYIAGGPRSKRAAKPPRCDA